MLKLMKKCFEILLLALETLLLLVSTAIVLPLGYLFGLLVYRPFKAGMYYQNKRSENIIMEKYKC